MTEGVLITANELIGQVSDGLVPVEAALLSGRLTAEQYQVIRASVLAGPR
ncbi:hypothetical protein AAII07_07635 [Microvirga sp. 0TCS3.31]